MDSFLLPTPPHPRQGHIVVQGTYTELLHSGVDFTSLLKKDEEEEKTGGTGTTESSCRRTLSQNSVRSETSSVVSNEADQLPVFVIIIYWDFALCVRSTVLSYTPLVPSWFVFKFRKIILVGLSQSSLTNVYISWVYFISFLCGYCGGIDVSRQNLFRLCQMRVALRGP